MVDLKKNYVKYSGRSIPTVIFDNCNELELMLGDWLGNNRSANEIMGLMMYKLGIVSDGDDIVHLCNFNKQDSSFSCIVNDNLVYDIKFKNLNLAGFNPEIVLSGGNVRQTYTCIPMNSVELGMRIVKSSESVYENDVCFTRYFSMDNALFTINVNGYILEFGVSKPSDVILPLFDGNGKYSKYTLDNEEMLVKYLTQLKFPVSIVDVYKDVCRITLTEVNKYPRILLKVSKIDNLGSMKIMDLIHLEKGQLESFGMTNYDNGRTLFLNKDGSWSCEMVDKESLIDFSMKVNNGKINYNIGINDGSDLDFTKSMIEDNIKYAREDIEGIKVLSRKLFDTYKKNSN